MPWGWRQVRKMHQSWERSRARSEAFRRLQGWPARPGQRTQQAVPGGGLWEAQRGGTPSASGPFQLHQHLSFPSWSQPLPGPPQPSCWLPSVPQAWMELPGGCARMMEILVYFKPLRDLTKFLKYFLPKVLFFCKTLFVGTLTSFFKYYHYVIVVFLIFYFLG